MKNTIVLLSLLNGLYMLADGIFAMINGKFIGPQKPGPWVYLFQKMDLPVFKLGPLFIVFGIFWLLFVFGLVTAKVWAFWLGITLCILTLWYLPFGTLISLIVIVLLLL